MTSKRIKMSRIKSLFNIIKLKIIYNLGKKNKYDIKVMPASKCVDEILSKKVSVAKFGDEEFDVIRGKSIGYQKYDKTLANRMLDMICLPDVFQNMDRYNDYCDYFYNSQFFVQNEKILRKIEDTILKFCDGKLVLIMLGPTAKIIVDDMVNKYHKIEQFFDLGHIDSEYEWFKMGAAEKVALSNKHTAEHNQVSDIVIPKKDKEFEDQVIARVY